MIDNVSPAAGQSLRYLRVRNTMRWDLVREGLEPPWPACEAVPESGVR
jgi:hypothetical protein